MSHGFYSVHPVVASILLLPNGAFPKLFPFFSFRAPMSSPPSRSFPRTFPRAISHGFPSVHPVVASISLRPHGAVHLVVASISLLPMQRSSLQAISPPSTLSSLPSRSFPCNGALQAISPPSTLSSLPSRSFPTELSPSYFPCFPLRPPCRRFCLAPSQRSYRSPSYFPRSPVRPNGALPKVFPTVSRPSTLSSLPYRSFPTELSPSYFLRFPLRPPCRRSHLAPSRRTSSQAIISHGFPPSNLSSLPSRSLPTVLSPSYFPSVHPVFGSSPI